MLIYNITIKVDAAIADQWLEWLVKEHVPEAMESGCFLSNKIVRLLDVDDSEGPTYAIQYSVESKADYNRYMELYAPLSLQKSIDKWGAGFIAFRSLMQVIKNQ